MPVLLRGMPRGWSSVVIRVLDRKPLELTLPIVRHDCAMLEVLRLSHPVALKMKMVLAGSRVPDVGLQKPSLEVLAST